jgi:hypothetical protein
MTLQRAKPSPRVGKNSRAAARLSAAFAVACGVLGAGGCGRHVPLGDVGDGGAAILWAATFEPGDLSEWTSDGQGGSYRDPTAPLPAVTMTQAHRGHYAGSTTFTTVPGFTSLSYLYRDQPSPPVAYYSAWFYIPSSFAVKSYLSLSHFLCSFTNDDQNLVPIWDVNIYPRPDGSLVAHLLDYRTFSNTEQLVPIPVPVDAWVHFEVMMRKAADATGEVAVWQDDAPILDIQNVITTPTDRVQWDAGGSSDSLVPPTGVVYVDDAAISLMRLGTSDWAPP